MSVSSEGFLNIYGPEFNKQELNVSNLLNTGYKYSYSQEDQIIITNNLCCFAYIHWKKTKRENISNLSKLTKYISKKENDRNIQYIIIGFILLNSPYELITNEEIDDYINSYLEHYYNCTDFFNKACDNFQFMLNTFVRILKRRTLEDSRKLLDSAFGKSIHNYGSFPFISQSYVNDFFKKLDYPIQYIDYFENDWHVIKEAIRKSSLNPIFFLYNKNALKNQNSIKIVISPNPFQSSFIMNHQAIFSDPEDIESIKHIIELENYGSTIIKKILLKIFTEPKDYIIKEFIELFKPIPEYTLNLIRFSDQYLEIIADYCNEPKSEHIIFKLYISKWTKKLYSISSQLKNFDFNRNYEEVINDIRYMIIQIHKEKKFFISFISNDNYVAFLNFITKSWNFLIDQLRQQKIDLIDESINFLQPLMKELYDEVFRINLK